MKIGQWIPIASALLALAAHGKSSDGKDLDAFVSACLASTNLERPLCECTARRAHDELSPGGFSLAVAILQNDEKRARELRGKLGMSEIIPAATFMTHAPAKCAEQM